MKHASSQFSVHPAIFPKICDISKDRDCAQASVETIKIPPMSIVGRMTGVLSRPSFTKRLGHSAVFDILQANDAVGVRRKTLELLAGSPQPLEVVDKDHWTSL
jgi:hypothetical protein